jgi:phage tail-like protein
MADTTIDPLNASFFQVDFGSGREGWFTSVSGGGSEFETITHKDVGKDGQVVYRAIPGLKKFTPLELQRGLTDSKALVEWFEKIESGDVKGARTNGSLVAYDQSHKEVARWDLTDCWPSKLTFPKLDVKSNEIALESMTIQHTGMKRIK